MHATTRRLVGTSLALGLLSALPGVQDVRAQSEEAPAAMSPEDWRADLDFLVETIEQVHPRPFHRMSRSDFESAVRALESRLPDLDDRESAIGLMGIVSLVSDGHTGLRPFGPFVSLSRWYPLRFGRLAEGTFITATDDAHRDWLGARVDRLGGLPIDEVWARATSVSSGDNPSSHLSNAALYLSLPDLLAGLGVGDGGPLHIELVIDGVGMRSETVEPLEWSPRFAWLNAQRGAPGGAGPRLPWDAGAEIDLPFTRHDPYWFERDGDLLYAQVNQIQNTGEPVWVGDEAREMTLTEFFDALLDEADRDPPEKLVIDLRWNGGGNNDLAKSLPRGIARRPHIDQADKLFVLTGRRTYSAAMNLVSMLEDQTNATFVGEPPGGSPHHYGDATGFTLPRSGLTLRVSTLHWSLGVGPWDVREGMAPDIPVAPSILALREGRDSALDAVRAFEPQDVLSERLFGLWQTRGHEAVLAELRRLEEPVGPVAGSHVQQLVQFTFRLFADGTTDQILEAARAITERYPESHEAWFALGRISGFLRRSEGFEPAYRRAHELRPQHDLIRRFWEAARRQAA